MSVLAALGASACRNPEPTTPTPWQGTWPSHFPPVVYTADNLTEEGVALGRALFYDPILSLDSTIACASCHHQNRAFADLPDRRLSVGIQGRMTERHSPAMFNLAWHPHFMWDGGANHLEVMPLAPLTNPLEMGESLAHIVAKLQAHKDYPWSFEQAFGSSTVTGQRVLQALAQFMASIVSASSPWDQGTMTAEAKAGETLFHQHCASCHRPPLFTDYSFRNNGLDSVWQDHGRARITLEASDEGKFAVPSLRNIALTPPYMHDGRFASLEEVLNHYATGVRASATLDPSLPVGGLGLSATEQKQILRFLEQLSDETLLQNTHWTNPHE